MTGNFELTARTGPTTRHRSRLLTGSTFRSGGLGVMFARHAISPIEVVGCATFPQEPVQSDSTNIAFARSAPDRPDSELVEVRQSRCDIRHSELHVP